MNAPPRHSALVITLAWICIVAVMHTRFDRPSFALAMLAGFTLVWAWLCDRLMQQKVRWIERGDQFYADGIRDAARLVRSRVVSSDMDSAEVRVRNELADGLIRHIGEAPGNQR